MAIGSEVGGEAAAIAYTMMASAAACGVDPVEWLADVLERITTCPPDRLCELLPDRWKAEWKAHPSASSDNAVETEVDQTGRRRSSFSPCPVDKPSTGHSAPRCRPEMRCRTPTSRRAAPANSSLQLRAAAHPGGPLRQARESSSDQNLHSPDSGFTVLLRSACRATSSKPQARPRIQDGSREAEDDGLRRKLSWGNGSIVGFPNKDAAP